MDENTEQDRHDDGQLDSLLPGQARFFLQKDEAKHDGGESPWPKPPHEDDGGGTEAGADQGDCHGEHPDHRQAQDGIKQVDQAE